MSHFIIFDEKDDTWKESDLLRDFASKYDEVKEMINSSKVSEAALDEAEDDVLPEESFRAVAELSEKSMHLLASLEEALEGLKEIAKEASDVKAKYEIEVAASKIDMLVKDLKGDENEV